MKILVSVISLVVINLIKLGLGMVYNTLTLKKGDTGKQLRILGFWVALFSIPLLMLFGGFFLADDLRKNLSFLNPDALLLIGLLFLMLLIGVLGLLHRDKIVKVYETQSNVRQKAKRKTKVRKRK